MKKEFNSLKDLFMDLLQNYELSESTCIGEFSNNMDLSYERLDLEVISYKHEFDRLYNQEIMKTNIEDDLEEERKDI